MRSAGGGGGDGERVRALLARLEPVPSVAARARLIERVAAAERPLVVSFVNAHALNLACADEAFFRALLDADMLLRDGIGMRLLCQGLGREPGVNMNGTDFIPELLRGLAGRELALYGTDAATLARAGERLGGVIERLDGFQPDEAYLRAALAGRARVFVLAMGMPKQERVSVALRRALAGAPGRGASVIINGGAVLDFIAGKVPRAPAWMREHGLEWLYRLGREPRRLWRRYLPGNAAFLARLVRLRAGA